MSRPAKRRPLIAANWKMHLLAELTRQFCRELRGRDLGGAEVVIFPSSTLLSAMADELEGSPIAWGGQDLHPAAAGAHTGDVSGPQLKDVGCEWVLCGHSERRHDHHEGDDLVRRKVAAAVEHGLHPMICVGETEAEREQGRTFEVLERQLRQALADEPMHFALAYEPVWAIGTGRTATPEMAQEAHASIRESCLSLLAEPVVQGMRILYGGSVKPASAAALGAQEDIDGYLVGGASLDVESFHAIIAASAVFDGG
jgi:triosephosphate isomerase